MLSIIFEMYCYYVLLYSKERKKGDGKESFKSIENHRFIFWSLNRKFDENSYFLQMLSIVFETYHYYVHLSYRKRGDEEGSFKSVGNHRFIFWSFKSMKIFISFKFCRLYSKCIVTMFLYSKEERWKREL